MCHPCALGRSLGMARSAVEPENPDRVAAKDGARIVGRGAVHDRFHRRPSVAIRSLGMWIFGRPHDAVGADIAQLAQPERIVLESRMTIVVPVMAGAMIQVIDEVA